MKRFTALLIILALIPVCALPAQAAAPFAELADTVCPAADASTWDGDLLDFGASENSTEPERANAAASISLDEFRSASAMNWFQVVERFSQTTVQLQNGAANGMLGITWLQFTAQAVASDLLVLPFDVSGRFIDIETNPYAPIQLGERYALTDGRKVSLRIIVDGTFTWDMYRRQVAPYLQPEEVAIPSNLFGLMTWENMIGVYGSRVGSLTYVVFNQAGRRIDSAERTMVAQGQHYVICAGMESTAKVLAMATVTAAPPVDTSASVSTWNEMVAMHPGVPIRQERCSTMIWNSELEEYISRSVTWLLYFMTHYVMGTTPIPFAADGSAIPPAEWPARTVQEGDCVYYESVRGTQVLIQMTNPTSYLPANYEPAEAVFGFPTVSMAVREPIDMAEAELGRVVRGIRIGDSRGVTRTQDLLAAFDCPVGSSCQLLTKDRDVKQSDQPVCTGDILVLTSMAGTKQEVTAIVSGDVLGSGMISIAQLVRMAQALTGDPLQGVYMLAGDMNNTGTVDIADLTTEAELLTGA